MLGVLLVEGDATALAWAVALSAGVILVATRVMPSENRGTVVAMTALALAVHMAVAVSLQSLAPGFGGGFVTGDDASYYKLSSQAARYLQGATLSPAYAPPLWGGDAYLFGLFVYVETALFLVFGPDVRIPILLNAALAVLAALLVFAMADRLFGRRAAMLSAAIIAFYPSIVLWSSLNLKDTLTIALGTAGVVALTIFRERPSVRMWLIAIAAAESLITLRGYFAAAVAIAAAVSVPFAMRSVTRGIAVTAVTMLAAVAITLQSLAAVGILPTQLLGALERERAAMAVGANTGFVPAAATPTAVVTGTRTAGPSPSGVLPPPTEAPLVPAEQEAPRRTLSYLPLGLAYAIFAPVPLTSLRIQELVAAPEMILWYALCAGALWTLYRQRDRWRFLLALVVTGMGILGVLALAEGNVGTLFRHRAMLVPLVTVLAAPSVIDVADLLALWRARPRL